MSADQYLVLGYGLGIGLLWGYAMCLWVASWSLGRRDKSN
jgi:hypothetical protein